MREILFRGKRVDNGKWIYGDFFQGKKDIFIEYWTDNKEYRAYEVDPETIGQYTGLEDKNGQKIFEGDILCFTDFDYITNIYYGIVKFGTYKSPTHNVINQGFYVDWQDVKYRSDLGYWANQSSCCVVGNIYDNPELLEVK